jgi:hypothetical protein
MRFRYLFPVLELALSVALVFIPASRCLPYYRLIGSDGREVTSVEGPPFDTCMANSEEFATGVNFPATLIVQPILLLKWEYSNDQHDWLHDTLWRSVGFTIVGVLVWFFVGRLFDDMIEWHRARAWTAGPPHLRSTICYRYRRIGDTDFGQPKTSHARDWVAVCRVKYLFGLCSAT